MKRLLILSGLIFCIAFAFGKKEAEFVKNWQLKSMNGVDVQAGCTMKINPNGQFIGKGYCNNFTGNFMFDGKKKVKCGENIAMTKKACPETEVMENEFFATLKKVDVYEIDDDVLYLKSQKQVVLTFVKVVEPKPEKGKKKKK